ncbi:MAG: terminase gpA endonuclease subunit, partial [Phycisphaerales bacterium]
LGPLGAEEACALAWVRWEGGGERAGVVGEGPRTRVASFSISGMYSPWTTWASLVHDYVKLGKNPPDKWWAGMLGRATQAVGRSIEPGSMKAHCLSLADGGYRRGTVPRGCLALFAGVDVQADRIYYVVRGFGAEGRSSWLIDYGALEAGDRHALVGAIERVKSRRYPLVDGHELAGLQGLRYTLERPEGMIERVGLPIIDLAVDSGDRTSEVYAACDQTGAQAAKGMSESRPGLVNFRMSQIGGAGRGAAGRAAPRLLLMVGGSYYKTMIVGHMAAAPPTAARDGSDRLSIEADKQRWWWPAYTADRTEPGGTVRRGDNHDRYWHQVTAERQVVATDRYGRAMAVWELREGRKDNHLLDCEVYACAIADRNEVRTFTRQMAVELYQEERG